MTASILHEIQATPIAELAQQPGEALRRFQLDAGDLLTAVKAVVEHIERAVDLKYADRARQLRLAAGKDTGVVHFDDGDIRVTADLPKRVEWDQPKLADLARRIAASGDDPTQYLEIAYRVSETKFNAWPESLKLAFVPARTLKTGKTKFTLSRAAEGQR